MEELAFKGRLKTANKRDISVLIGISSNGGIMRDLQTIIGGIARQSINLRMVIDLNSEEIVWKNPDWEYLAEEEPTTYYHYQTWEYQGKTVGMTLNPEETAILDDILNYEFFWKDYYEEEEEEFYAECKR